MASSKPDLSGVRLIFYALLAGQLLFAAVVIFLLSQQEEEARYLLGPGMDLPVIAAYALAMVFLSRFIDGMWKKQIPNVLRFKRPALGHYRNNVIVRLAILEGAGLLTIVMAFVTRNPQLLIATLFVLGAFWLARPREEEMRERYGSQVVKESGSQGVR